MSDPARFLYPEDGLLHIHTVDVFQTTWITPYGTMGPCIYNMEFYNFLNTSLGFVPSKRISTRWLDIS